MQTQTDLTLRVERIHGVKRFIVMRGNTLLVATSGPREAARCMRSGAWSPGALPKPREVTTLGAGGIDSEPTRSGTSTVGHPLVQD